jgi:hypothetical protein
MKLSQLKVAMSMDRIETVRNAWIQPLNID